MARFFIYLSYKGTNYCGWQRQPNAPTVQQTLEEALSTLLRRPTGVVGAGRTDTGVHARLMVAHFDAVAPLDPGLLAFKLNGLLPKDIAIRGIRPVSPDAHARFDAKTRTYHYFLGERKDPFRDELFCRVSKLPDFAAMNAAAARLLGYTDFTSFSKLHTDVKTNNCRLSRADWTEADEGLWRFSITADRFLRDMVRAIVGTLLEVGRGKLDEAGFCRIVEGRNRSLAGSSAPARGLFLADIQYPEDLFLPQP
jgi:tRNA pseudouridine38-40 synthase